MKYIPWNPEHKTHHSITTMRHFWSLYVFSNTSLMLTMCLHPLARQWRSISRLLFTLSFKILRAHFSWVLMWLQETTLPLIPRPSTSPALKCEKIFTCSVYFWWICFDLLWELTSSFHRRKCKLHWQEKSTLLIFASHIALDCYKIMQQGRYFSPRTSKL